MSGIGEFAYTVLLGWMRGLVDWFWSMFAGTGNTGAWQWFLSNWKIWLIVLLVGGLVVDWLMWVVRWRPYRVFFSRFGRAPATEGADMEAWDNGVGYYEPETAMDADAPDWAETTFATLSEIDPNWADGIVIEEDDEPLYDPTYDPHDVTFNIQPNVTPPVVSEQGYYDDALLWGDEDMAEETSAAPQEDYGMAETWAEQATDDVYAPEPPSGPLDAYAASYAPEAAQPVEDACAYEDSEPYEEQTRAPAEDTGPLLYGRPGMWPGAQFPLAGGARREAEAAPEDVRPDGADAYDPLYSPEPPVPEDTPAPRRRRRRLYESENAIPQEQPAAQPPPEPQADVPAWLNDEGRSRRTRRTPPPDDMPQARPERLVQPVNAYDEEQPPVRRGRGKRDNEVRTVTGKPAKPRGLRRFMLLQEEAISGLPPMDLTDPFLPAARPGDPDFVPDDGEYDETP